MIIPQGGTKTSETSHKNAPYRFQRTKRDKIVTQTPNILNCVH